MLKVTVKNEKVVDDRWEPGMIRMSKDADSVIMIVKSIFSGSATKFGTSIEYVYLDSDIELTGRVFSNYKDSLSHDFPIVVENAELIIGGGSND